MALNPNQDIIERLLITFDAATDKAQQSDSPPDWEEVAKIERRLHQLGWSE